MCIIAMLIAMVGPIKVIGVCEMKYLFRGISIENTLNSLDILLLLLTHQNTHVLSKYTTSIIENLLKVA